MGDEKVIALLLMQQIAVLFLIMGLGFLIVKLGIVKTEDSRVLSMVTIYLVLPCVTIHAFQIEYSTKIRNGFLLAVAVAILIHVVLFVVCGILRKLLKMDEVETASLIYSNAGNLILPLVTSILGEEWVIYASGFMCVQTIIVWTHGQSLMQGQRQVNWKKIVQNINLIAILTGLVFFLCNIHLPKIIDSMTSSLAGMIGPISMVMIGMLLAGVDWKLVFGKRRIYGIVFLKMIVVPGIITLCLKLTAPLIPMENAKTILLISLLAVIAPTAVTITQMAQLYKRDAAYASSINVFTTLVCIVTMPLMVMLYMI